MSNTPSDLRYSKSHEWVRNEGDGSVTIGITEHAQELLGDMVFVELPEVGDSLDIEDEVAVVESVKAASDVYSPVAGEVIAVNEALNDTPEAINEDPYGDGWIYKVKLADAAQLDALMDAEAYQAQVAEEE
ncbi:glycine cleavage system protein GcvH [Candidatus Endoriftia persephone]|jgi:glycine cleavage system H protein|uniref:Glycine cleavage system H protein n=3 Tax=Gammaproteobacteria TaxID=1236 RepID=G2FFY5_9GAMM|nr:glycine cleavage system protein GcvH [Candidatus Endoriftia persephone]EGV52767.1 glycine cleavage system H protein [endosymbiont of Riftia pachyptila (vent Ph05)]EGW54218.1 glycine cleavage system H protein [endosymbiont of Tevnia jerichonana (vent Tica)]USF87481.1 glycine cleavage system protein GcvH [Candidatus Endoriftia persephone]